MANHSNKRHTRIAKGTFCPACKKMDPAIHIKTGKCWHCIDASFKTIQDADLAGAPLCKVQLPDAIRAGDPSYWSYRRCTIGGHLIRPFVNKTWKCHNCWLDREVLIGRARFESRADAIKAGRKFYWTGSICHNKHVSVRVVYTGMCLMCLDGVESSNVPVILTMPPPPLPKPAPIPAPPVEPAPRGRPRIDGPTKPIVAPLMTRKVARGLGFKHYNTGRPCRNGHTSHRYVSTGNCAECTKLANRKVIINVAKSST